MTRRRRKQECWLRPIIVWDTETTGLSQNKHRIVEIALMELRPGPGLGNGKSFTSFVRPSYSSRRCTIPSFSAQTKQHLDRAPSFAEVWPKINDFVESVSKKRGRPILVAHNLTFDSRFLTAELLRINETLPDWDFACSLRDVAHVVWPGEPASLASLVHKLKITHEEPHRALPDVQATLEVLACADSALLQNAILAGESPRNSGYYIRELLERAAARRKANTSNTDERYINQGNTQHSNYSVADDGTNYVSGRSGLESQKENDRNIAMHEGQVVYITPKGFLWHADRACKRLDSALTIFRISSPPQSRLPCSVCTTSQKVIR